MKIAWIHFWKGLLRLRDRPESRAETRAELYFIDGKHGETLVICGGSFSRHLLSQAKPNLLLLFPA